MTITHTLSRIVATGGPDLRFVWSDGYEEARAPDWTGYMRGSIAGHSLDGEWERSDGTEPFNDSDEVLAVFVAAGGVIEAYVEPEPAVIEPHLNYGGLARFTGAAPVTILEAIRMAGVTRISKGRYRISHETPMPSDQYSVMPSVMDLLPRTIRVTARTASYVEIRITDLAGVAQDPAEAIVKTERVISL